MTTTIAQHVELKEVGLLQEPMPRLVDLGAVLLGGQLG